MKILETRKRSAGFTYRLYRRDDGTTLATWEVPKSVLQALGSAARLEACLATFRRGEAQRAKAAKLRAAVAERKGWKATAVAHELGITEARVRQIRAGK